MAAATIILLSTLSGDHNFTVTACFKQPRREHVPEAWHVLIRACRSNALLLTVVAMNYRKVIATLGVGLPNGAHDPGREEKRIAHELAPMRNRS